jgi:sulfite exporter TauE/SafE
MNEHLQILLLTAASLGFFHTLLGPDHYLPFVVMSKARNWSPIKTALITIACGIGHVGSSVLLGFIGIAFGIALHRLEWFESVRGDLAGWAFFIFGFVYLVWGLHRALKKKKHTHPHYHLDNSHVITHQHEHSHLLGHAHVHETPKKNITPWVLFLIFVLGPCEPLIPLLMYPAAQNSLYGTISVTLMFGLVTLLTMLSMVFAGYYGLKIMLWKNSERYIHAIAGGTICFSGFAILFLGW